MTISENTVTITGVYAGGRTMRAIGATASATIDPRGQDIAIWWTAVGPRGHGCNVQPYAQSQMGGALLTGFKGWDIEVWIYDTGSASTGTLRRVGFYHVGQRQMTFVWTEEENTRAAARFGLGFQTVVKFVVWAVTEWGRGPSSSVTTTAGTGTGWAKWEPLSTQRKWLPRGLLVQQDNRDVCPIIGRHGYGVSSPTANLLELTSNSGSILARCDSAGKLYGTGIDAGSQKGTNFADPTNALDAVNYQSLQSKASNKTISWWIPFDGGAYEDSNVGSFVYLTPAIDSDTSAARHVVFPEPWVKSSSFRRHVAIWVPDELDLTASVSASFYYIIEVAGTGSVKISWDFMQLASGDIYSSGGTTYSSSNTKTVTSFSTGALVIQDLGVIFSANALHLNDYISGAFSRDGTDSFNQSIWPLGVKFSGTKKAAGT